MPSTKPSKAKGPIRWKGFVPLTLLVAGVLCYFIFLFDIHLKWLLELSGTKLNGAKVEIGSLKTSFREGSFTATKIQIASTQEAMKNKIEIGDIQFDFMLEPLLSKKLVIEQMGVNSIAYGTPRKKSGLLPKSEAEESGMGNLIEKYMPGLQTAIQDQIPKDPLGSIGKLFSNFDINAELKRLETSLASKKAVEETLKDIDFASKELPAKVKALPDTSYLSKKTNELKSVTQRSFKSPADVQNAINDINRTKNDIDNKIKEVEQTHQLVTEKVGSLQNRVASIDKLIDDDINQIKSQLKLPTIDLKNLSEGLFAPSILNTINKASYYVALTRKYLPKGKPGENVTVVKKEREKGTDILFGVPAKYPTFWLKRASFSSNVSEDAAKGALRGELTNVNSNPPSLGIPTELNIDGDLPKSNIVGIRIHGSIDHTQDIPKEFFELRVGSLPVEDFSISQSEDLTLAIKKSRLATGVSLSFTGEQMQSTLLARFSDVQYITDAKQPKLQKVLSNIMNSLDRFSVKGEVKGSFSKPKLSIQSDLGDKLASGFKNELQSEINAVDGAIRKKIGDEVGTQKAKANTALDKLKANALRPVQDKLDKINQVKRQAENAITEVQNRVKSEAEQKAKSAAEEKAKQGLKGLKKKFGF